MNNNKIHNVALFSVQSSKMAFLLCLFLLSKLATIAQCIISPTTLTTACTGDTKALSISVPTAGYTYSWSVTPSTGAVIINSPGNSVNVYFTTAGVYTISVLGTKPASPNENCSKVITVVDAPNPQITFNNQVGCQGQLPQDGGHPGNVILDDGNGCVKVCENSIVEYTALGQIGSTFEWTPFGGSFYAGYNMNSNPVKIQWDNTIGNGFIKIKETNSSGCVTEKQICIERIETPVAIIGGNFSFQNANGCFDICKDKTIFFQDLSTPNNASATSPIISWVWDFGDGSPFSAAQNPIHQYSVPGNYVVELEVTNSCNCKSKAKICFEVNEQPGPDIFCPKIVCQNEFDTYYTNSTCNPYLWSVVGGEIYKDAGGMINMGTSYAEPDPNIQSVIVHWNNVGPSGFGQLTLDGSTCNDACNIPTTIYVPVIQSVGTIDGPIAVCLGEHYRYKLPAWPATNFNWGFSTNTCNAIFASYDENSNEVEIIAGNSSGAFTLNCSYQNTVANCAGTASINVNVTPRAIIQMQDELCVGSSLQATINNVGPLTSNTIWTISSAGGTFTYNSGISNPATIPGTFFPASGFYQISASNSVDFCDPFPRILKVQDPPPPPNSVSGQLEVCPGFPYSYTAVNDMPGTYFSWEVPSNPLLNASGSNVSITWPGPFPYTLEVYRVSNNIPGCKSSPAVILNINNALANWNSIGITGGGSNVCTDGQSIHQLDNIPLGFIPEAIEWKVTTPLLGSVVAGQGANSATFQWNHVNTTSTATIECKIIKCGTFITKTINVTIQPLPTFAVTSTSPQCSGDPIVFTATPSILGATATFNWIYGDGTNDATGSHTYTNVTTSNINYAVTLQASAITVSGSSCSGSGTSTHTVTVSPQPEITMSPAGIKICTSGGVPTWTFTISPTITGGPITRQWAKAPSLTGPWTNITTAATLTVGNPGVNQDGFYRCTVTKTSAPFCDAFAIFRVEYDPTCFPVLCTPLTGTCPTTFVVTPQLLGCGKAKATSTACNGTNTFVGFNWDPKWTPVSAFGSQFINSSYDYTFTAAGQYRIEETIDYKDAGNPTLKCPLTKSANIVIPIVAKIKYEIVCNPSNNGYTLNLTDISSKFPGTIATTNRRWNLNAGAWSANQVLPTYTWPTSLSGNTLYTIGLISAVGTAIGQHCTTYVSFTTPPLPSASYVISTTDPLSTAASVSTCEWKKVQFTNTSSLANIQTLEYGFGDLSSYVTNPLSPNAEREYNNLTAATANYITSLKITNNQGCWSTATKAIDVYNNTINGNYSPVSQTLCYNTPTSILANITTSPLNSPYTFKWFNYNAPVLPNQNTNNFLMNAPPYINVSGAYWTEVTDKHGCVRNVNNISTTPDPALVTYLNPPITLITGKQDVCLPDPVKLNANIGTNSGTVTYSWVRNPGNVNVGSLSSLVDNIWTAGVYVYTLTTTITYGVNTCSSTSNYTVTTHPIPTAPSLSYNMLNCQTYSIELAANPPVTLPALYTWSSGGNGNTTIVNYGGAFRCWITDQYGCTNHVDMDVPKSPSSYFWRLPYGCLTLCPNEVPLQVDGPYYESFNYWEWLINGATVPLNGPYASQGAGNTCDPLWIDLDPGQGGTGSGSGTYQWTLGNALCTQTSHNWDVKILDHCCDVQTDIIDIHCIDPALHLYQIDLVINFNSGACQSATYNLSIVDASNNVIGFFSIPSGFLNVGSPTFISTQFTQTVNFMNPVTLIVQAMCGNENCISEYPITMPDCGEIHELKPISDSWSNAELSKDVKLVPNPAGSQVIVYYNLSELSSTTNLIQVMDATGRILYQNSIERKTGNHQINVANFASGIYFVNIYDNGKIISSNRLSVQH